MRPRWWGFLRDACEKRAWRGWEDPPPPPQGLVLRCQEGKPGSHRRRDNGALGENREGNWWRGGPSRGSVHTGRCNHQARAALHPFMGPHSTKTETPGWSWGGQMRTGQELGLSICEEGSGILAQGTNWDKPTHKRTGAAVLAAASLGKCKWPSLPTHALLAWEGTSGALQLLRPKGPEGFCSPAHSPAPPTPQPRYLDSLGNLNPLDDGHVTGVKKGLALQHRVDDPLVGAGGPAGGRMAALHPSCTQLSHQAPAPRNNVHHPQELGIPGPTGPPFLP